MNRLFLRQQIDALTDADIKHGKGMSFAFLVVLQFTAATIGSLQFGRRHGDHTYTLYMT